MKTIYTLLLLILLSGCYKEYSLESCNWVHVTYLDEHNSDSLRSDFYTKKLAYVNGEYSDTIKCWSLWVMTTDSTQVVRYTTDSVNSYSVDKYWITIEYETSKGQ